MKSTQEIIPTIKPSSASLIWGIISILLFLVPFINMIVAGIGLSLSTYKMRKIQINDDGYRYVTFATWAHLPGILKAGIIVSAVGLIIAIPGTFIGVIFWSFILTSALN